MNPFRRLIGAVAWRVRRFRQQRWDRRGPRTVGKRRPQHLVIHAPVTRGVTTEIGATLAAATGLARKGILVLGPADLRQAGAGWSGATGESDPAALAEAMHDLLATREVGGPFRALLVTSGRALGRGQLTPAEITRLRPDAAATIDELITAIRPRRVTVVVEHPDPDDLRDEIVAGEVVAGRPAPSLQRPEPAVFADLALRIGRLRRVRQVVVLGGPEATARRFADVLGARLRWPLSLGKRPVPGTAPWTLRSAQAAAAVLPHLESSERPRIHTMLRNTLASAPARRPSLLAPSPAAIDVAPAGALRLHLHVGLQKTATTTVQAALHAASRQLADQGVAYLGRRHMMRMADRRAWRAYTHTGTASFEKFTRQVQAEVARIRNPRNGETLDTVLISNESAVGAMEKGPFLDRPFRPRAEGAISDLLDILQPDSCDLILVVRRQDTLLESQYMWQIHGGESFPFDRYVSQVLRHPDTLSHYGLAGRLRNLPGVTGLTVVPFEIIRHGLDRFLGALLAPSGATVDLEAITVDPVLNPAYSERALEIALAVNPHLRGRKEHRLMRDHLRDLLPVETWGRPTLLDDDTRRSILDAVAADNEALFRQWMPGYPAAAYATTDTDRLLGAQPRSNSPGAG